MAYSLNVPSSLLGPEEGREERVRMTDDLCPITLNLKTHVHTRAVGLRPFIELEPTDHPLAIEQREGITMARIQEIAEQALHPPSAAQS